jgi:hypothetical protein
MLFTLLIVLATQVELMRAQSDCATVASGTCTACTSSSASDCTAVTCDSGYSDLNNKAADGCELTCATVADGTCSACTILALVDSVDEVSDLRRRDVRVFTI